MTFALVALALMVLALPFAREELRPAPARTYADGQVATLSKGKTFYRWSGPEDGPIAVCVHGLTTPSFVFSGVTRTLSALGYRVLTYDLYGRGLSDRPAGAQTPSFFLGQLDELLHNQGITGRITLVGYSMGASIATAAAARDAKRVHALILMAPAGLYKVPALPLDRLLTVPILGDWVTRLFGGWLLRRQIDAAPLTPTMIPDLRDRQLSETRTRGFLPAALSARRHTLSQTFHGQNELIRAAGVPLLAIWGRKDDVIPLTALGKLAQLNPDAHHVEIAGAGHGFPQTHPAQVAEALKAFLQPRSD